MDVGYLNSVNVRDINCAKAVKLSLFYFIILFCLLLCIDKTCINSQYNVMKNNIKFCQ